MNQDKLDYFIDVVNERFDKLEAKLDKSDSKIDKLWDHKNLLLGGAAVISVLAGTVTALLIAFIERG